MPDVKLDSEDESFLEAVFGDETPKKRSATIKILAAVVSSLCIGTFMFFVFNNAQPEPEPTQPTPTPVEPEPTSGDRPPVAIPSDREYADAIDERVHDELVEFSQWLVDNESYAIIGEFGWPRDIDEGGEQWRTIGENWLRDLAQTNMVGYYWATGGAWGNYTLAVHNSEDQVITSVNSQSFQLNAFSKDNELGINMAGLEFGTNQEGYSNDNPGTLTDKNYIYNTKPNYDYIAEEGYTSVRIPFTWERLQPELNGPLDEKYLDLIKTSVEFAHDNDMSVMLDLHNYGEYDTADDTLKLGSSALPHSALVDVWERLSAVFGQSEGVVMYGIMNEPRSLDAEQWASPAANWEAASQSVVSALRALDDESEIVIGGYNWAKLSTWSRYHPTAWIDDPLNNTIYEAHHYWDSDTSGMYTGGYQ